MTFPALGRPERDVTSVTPGRLAQAEAHAVPAAPATAVPVAALRAVVAAAAAGAVVATNMLIGPIIDVLMKRHRQAFILRYRFPDHIWAKALDLQAGLKEEHRDAIELALRHFFLAVLFARRRAVAMPSDAVDALWHSMILHTHEYEHFCRHALGRFLHHSPNGAPSRSAESIRAELWRTWVLCCRMEGIDACAPDSLPTLFSADATLLPAAGWHYSLKHGQVTFARNGCNRQAHADLIFPENRERFLWVTALPSASAPH